MFWVDFQCYFFTLWHFIFLLFFFYFTICYFNILIYSAFILFFLRLIFLIFYLIFQFIFLVQFFFYFFVIFILCHLDFWEILCILMWFSYENAGRPYMMSKTLQMVVTCDCFSWDDHFLHELIGYVELADFHEIWPEHSLRIKKQKAIRDFLYHGFSSCDGCKCKRVGKLFNVVTLWVYLDKLLWACAIYCINSYSCSTAQM